MSCTGSAVSAWSNGQCWAEVDEDWRTIVSATLVTIRRQKRDRERENWEGRNRITFIACVGGAAILGLVSLSSRPPTLLLFSSSQTCLAAALSVASSGSSCRVAKSKLQVSDETLERLPVVEFATFSLARYSLVRVEAR